MDETGLNKVWPNSQLNTAINCITFGIGCLYFDRIQNQMRTCLLSVHQEYINIVHVIIDGKVSFLFELQNVRSISNRDIYIRQTLKSMNYEHFIVIYTSALQSHVLVMESENQINVLWEGLQYFVYQAQSFYSRISSMDPFKAETAMLFMNADADGSKLLDLDEVLQIFNKLKINKNKKEIEESILQINQGLYQKQNLKRPKDFEMTKLTPLGFEYILQYYSLKASLAPIFTEFCPIFKFKHKQFKKGIIDILKSQTKPLMSGVQFQQFLIKYMKMQKTQKQCLDLIKTFPIYDGEGKQIPEQIEYLSFHNFCNYIFSQKNSIMDPTKSEVYQNMNLPLNQYYVYSSCLSESSKINESILQTYQFSLKKGCRCVEIPIHVEKEEIIVRHLKSKRSALLVDVLKTIKNIAFSFNHFPVILSVQFNFTLAAAERVAQIFKSEIGQYLFLPSMKETSQNSVLPSPLELKKKMILQLYGNARRTKQQEALFSRVVALMPTKLDFQRKGLNNWNTCQITPKDIVKHEEIEDKNLTDYTRRVLVRTSPNQLAGELENYDPMPMFRNGVQVIALNIQKQDKHHYLIHSKFLENGGRNCGYLLKPPGLHSNSIQSLYATSYTKQLFSLKIKVFAGQQYVLADTDSSNFTLEIYLRGTKIEEQKNKKYASEPKSEGFYTDFEMQCEFFIYYRELAMIVFSIVSEKSEILAYRAIPIDTMREGLRTVELLGPGMELSINSCLVVEALLVEEKSKKKIATLLL